MRKAHKRRAFLTADIDEMMDEDEREREHEQLTEKVHPPPSSSYLVLLSSPGRIREITK